MFKIGPNPYGISCCLGLQGTSPHPKDVFWYLGFAESIKAKCIEFHFAHLADLSADSLAEISGRLAASGIEPVISGPWPLPRLPEAFPFLKLLGGRTVRTHLSPVLCGGRAAQGDKWREMVAEIRTHLPILGPRALDQGLVIAIENHQDFGSEELLEFCEMSGPGVGVCLDTGNPLAVCEEPLAFARRVAKKVRHIHLKDYRAQGTPEGYRLVRCAIGDGAIPFKEIHDIVCALHSDITATIEPGALNSRHIEMFTDAWWKGYKPKSDKDKNECLAATGINAIPRGEDCRTPWERGDDPEVVCQFEMDQMMRSVENIRTMGWLPK